MSQPTANPASPPGVPQDTRGMGPLRARHYQALGGLALAAIFLLQLQQSGTVTPVGLMADLFVVFTGTLGLLYRVRLSPIPVLLALAVPRLIEQYHSNQVFGADFRTMRFDLEDILLSAALLTYLIAQYRLHGLWFGVLPSDPRQTVAEQARRESSLTAAELIGLIFPVPTFALLAEFAALLLKQHWTLLDVQPRSHQLLVVAWAILLAMFLAAHGFRYWRRQEMDAASAQLLLQDALWSETRGEQRRINRWWTWRKLRAEK
jgi:hypothetical protein